MSLYVITVSGCDDATEIVFSLNPAQADLLRVIAERINEASDYSCQPVMFVGEVK